MRFRKLDSGYPFRFSTYTENRNPGSFTSSEIDEEDGYDLLYQYRGTRTYLTYRSFHLQSDWKILRWPYIAMISTFYTETADIRWQQYWQRRRDGIEPLS